MLTLGRIKSISYWIMQAIIAARRSGVMPKHFG
jgi:hypothetical protein